MITNLNILADRLKGTTINGKEITAEDLMTFIASEEKVEISVSKMNILSDTELETVKEAVKKSVVPAGDSGYVEGMKAGTEQLVKAFRKTKGLEFEGKLKYGLDGKIDFDATASHVSEHLETKVLADAKLEPEKRIQELDLSLKKVQKAYDEDKLSWEVKTKEYEGKVKSLNQDYFIQTNLPKVEGLNEKQLSALLKADGYNVDFDENGKAYPVQFGKPIVDKMERPVSFDLFAKEYVEKNGWSSKPIGKAGGDEKPEIQSKFATKNEAFAHMEKNKIDPTSSEGQKILKKFDQE
ncbi:MAG: hypothetical protein WC401_13340 [Bacteroidales bacterium]